MESIYAAFLATLLHIVQPYALRNDVHLTQHDTACLTEAIYYEARSEALDGADMAYVVLNRAAKSHKTLCQVIHEHRQFSYRNTRLKPIHELDAWKFSAYLAVYTQLGLIENRIGNATSYNEHPVAAWNKDHILTHHIGSFYYYRKRDQPEFPPLVQTTTMRQPSYPRVVFCDMGRDGRPRSSMSAVQTETRTIVTFNLWRKQTPIRDKDPPSDLEDATIWLPLSVPFPREPSLDLNQVVVLASALNHSYRPKEQRVIHHSDHRFAHAIKPRRHRR